MGTYHIIDGANITVNYPGLRRTCGRCHQTSQVCPGESWAKKCEENGGQKVKLLDHMKSLWQEIGFNPSKFQLEDVENVDYTADVQIKDTNFTPEQRKNKPSPEDKSKFTGVTIKNFPKDIPEPDLVAFLETKGLPMGWKQIKLYRNERNTNVDVDDLEPQVCENLIEGLHENIYFGMKTYCRGMLNVVTPVKTTENEPTITSRKASDIVEPIEKDKDKSKEIQSLNKNKKSTKSGKKKTEPEKDLRIPPGLSVKDFKKAQKKAKKNLQIESSLGDNEHDKSDLATGCVEDNYVFSDAEESSDSENGDPKKGFFRKSPLDQDDPIMSSTPFKSRTAKAIQKEELWNIQVQKGRRSKKRQLQSPEEMKTVESKKLK